MDPNAALADALETVATIQAGIDDCDDAIVVNAAEVLAETFMALNDWLGKQGFLPDAWRQPLVPAFGANPTVDQMLWDVFVTAMEGGVNFWAACEGYRNTKDDRFTDDLEGFHADIIDAEHDRDDPDAEFPPSRIDRAVMAKAFERVATGSVEGWADKYRTKFVVMLHATLAGTEPAANWDAYDAQALVQVGLFGKVIFG